MFVVRVHSVDPDAVLSRIWIIGTVGTGAWMRTRVMVGKRNGPGSGAVAAGLLPVAAVGLAEWLSVVPALVHLWAVPEHLKQWWGYGAFFLASAVFQGVYALGLDRWHDRDWFLLAGVAANASIVVLWMVSRIRGMPRPGPESGHIHAVGVLDSVATLSEAALVLALAIVFVRLPRTGARSCAVDIPSPRETSIRWT